MKERFKIIIFVVFIFTLFTMPVSKSASKLPNQIMQEIVEEFVLYQADKGTAFKVVGLGSWITGDGYRNPLTGGTSDHDMRLIMPDNWSEATKIEKWKEAQTYFKQRIKDKFGEEGAEIMLSKVNIYPPDELIGDVTNSAQVIEKFKNKLKGTPSLADEAVEGFFGKHNQAFRQLYELKKGFVFYFDEFKKKVFKGYTDLEHLAEGYGKYTFTGVTKAAGDAMEHIDDAIKAGDVDAAIKQMNRMKDNLKKARDLRRLSPGGSQIDDVLSQLRYLKDNGKPLNDEVLKSLKEVMTNSQTEINLLESLGNFEKGMKGREAALALDILEESTGNAASKSKSKIFQVLQNLPTEKIMKVIEGAFVFFDMYQSGKAAYEGDFDGAYRNAFASAMANISLPVGGLAILTNIFLDYVKEKGYATMIKKQDCVDLFDGICTVQNTQGVIDTKRDFTNVEDVINKVSPSSTEEFQKAIKSSLEIVTDQCLTREHGKFTDEQQKKRLKEPLYNKCLTELTRIWSLRRVELMGNFVILMNQFFEELQNTPISLSYEPNPVIADPDKPDQKPTVTVNAEYNLNQTVLKEKYKQAAAELRKVANVTAYIDKVVISTKWYLNGIVIGEESREYTGGTLDLIDTSTLKKQIELDPTKVNNVTLEIKYKTDIKSFIVPINDDIVTPIVKKYTLNREVVTKGEAEIGIIIPEDYKVTIEGPETLYKDEYNKLSAKISDSIRKLPHYYINWYQDKTKNTADASGETFSVSPPKDKESVKYIVTVTTDTQDSFTKSLTSAIKSAINTKKNGENAAPIKEDPIVVIAQTEKTFKIETKSFKDQIEKAFKDRNYKQLFELLNKTKADSDIKLIKEDLKQIATEFNQENQALFDKLKAYNDQNESLYKSFREPMSQEYQKLRQSRDSNDLKKAEDLYKCLSETETKYNVESHKISSSIYPLESLLSDYKGLNFDSPWQYYYEKCEKKALSIPLDIKKPLPSITYVGYCKDTKAISDLNNKRVSISSIKDSVKPGEKLELEAHFDMPRYIALEYEESYKWSGEVTPVDSSVVAFSSTAQGPHKVTVTVEYDGEVVGSATKDIIVTGEVQGKIIGLPDTMFYGAHSKLKAIIAKDNEDLTGDKCVQDSDKYSEEYRNYVECEDKNKNLPDNKKASCSKPVAYNVDSCIKENSDYKILFNSTPNLDFGDPDKYGDTSYVIINRFQDKIPIWADIYRNENGVKKTIGTTDQVEVKVLAPKFTFRYDPSLEDAKIGKPIKVTIEANPSVQDDIIDYRWVEPANIKLIQKNGSVVEITPKDSKPVNIHVIARVPVLGDTINDSLKDILNVGMSQVKVNVLGLKYEKPVKIWNETKKIEEETSEYAVDQQISAEAVISTTKYNDVKYSWSVDSGSSIISGVNSREVTVSKNSVGNIELKVEARDKDNNLIGEGVAIIPVTVSKDKIKKPKATSEEIDKIIEQAKNFVTEGKLDDAIKLLEDSLKVNPDEQKIDSYLKKLQSEKDKALKAVESAKASADKGDLATAKSSLKQAQDIHPKYQPVLDTANYIADIERKQGSKKLLEDARKLYTEDKIDEAYQLLKDGIKTYSEDTEIPVELNKVKQEIDSITSKISSINSLLSQEKIKEAQTAFTTLKQSHPYYKAILDLESSIKSALNNLINKRISVINDQILKGLLDEAIISSDAAFKEFPDSKEIENLALKLKTERDYIKQHYSLFNNNVAYAKYEEAEQELNNLNSSPHKSYKDVVAANNIWANRRTDRMNQARAKLDEAQSLVSNGLLSEGIAKAQEGYKFNKDDVAITQFINKITSEKTICDDQVKKVSDLIYQKQFDKAQIELNVALNLHKLYKPVRDALLSIEDAKNKELTRKQLVDGKIQQAKWRAENEGKMDEAIAFADEAVALDPQNQYVIDFANQLKKDKNTMLAQVEKVKNYVNQGNLNQARAELDIAKRIYPKYQPVVDAENLINGKVTSISKEVDQKIGEAQSALGNNYYQKTLAIIQQVRQNYKPDQNQQITLNNMEAIAKNAISKKQQALNILKIGENYYNQKDYQNALSNLEQGLGSFGNPWEPTDTEPGYYWNLKSDCMQKLSRINQLINLIAPVANNNGYSKSDIEIALRNTNELLSIQPQNNQGITYKQILEQKLDQMNNSYNNNSSSYSNNNQTQNWQNQQGNNQNNTNNNTMVKDLVDQCNNLYTQGKLEEALQKCKELDIVYPNPFTKKRITEISTTLANKNNNHTSPTKSNTNITTNTSKTSKTPTNSSNSKNTATNTSSNTNSGYNPTTEICKWTGNWQTSKGNLALNQYGNQVTGTYDQNGGRVNGSASGRMFSGYWSQMPSYQPPYDYGKVNLTISSDCKSFTGDFHSDSDHVHKPWNGTKIADSNSNTSSTKITNTKTSSSSSTKTNQINSNNSLPSSSSGCYDGDYAGTVSMDKLTGNVAATVRGSVVTGKVTGNYYNVQFQSDWSGTVDVRNGNVTGKVNNGHIGCYFKELDYTADFFGKIQGNSASGTVNGYSQRGNRTATWTINRLSSTGNCTTSSGSNTLYTPANETKISDNGNTGGCGYTDSSRFSLRQPAVVTKLEIWFNWEGAQSKMPYTLSSQLGMIRSGEFTRGACDTYQKQWCQGLDSLLLTLPTGNYLVKTAKGRMCQNSGSGGNGMIKVYSDPVATANVLKNPSSINQPVSQNPVNTQNQNLGSNNIKQIVKTPSSNNYDGNYTGSIINQDGDIGKITFTISNTNVSGTAGGIFEGDDFTVYWSGSVNTQTGQISGNITKGVLTTKQYKQDYPFTGKILGTVQNGSASGNWNASNNWGSGSGSWKASKNGASFSNSNINPVSNVNKTSSAFPVAIRIFNNSSNNVHLFTDGETFGPSNKTAPGSSRSFTVNFTTNSSVKLYAGRNGQVLSTIIIPYNTMNGFKAAHYIFDDSQELKIKEKFK